MAEVAQKIIKEKILVSMPVKQTEDENKCGVCGLALEMHDNENIMDCLVNIAYIKDGEYPTLVLADAVNMANRVGGTSLSFSQEPKGFAIAMYQSPVWITVTPARDICLKLLSNYTSEQ